jgi:hypothetical protein
MADRETARRESSRAGAGAMAERTAFLTNEAGEGNDPRERRRRLAAGLTAAARAGTRGTGRGAQTGREWLAAQAVAMAPRLRARDRAALRAQYPGLGTEELAGALIEDAARASATPARGPTARGGADDARGSR